MAIDADAASRAAFIPQRGVSPFMVAGAQGNYLIGRDGRRILDAGGGAIVVNIGHGREEVAERGRAWPARGHVCDPAVRHGSPHSTRRAADVELAAEGAHARGLHERRLGIRGRRYQAGALPPCRRRAGLARWKVIGREQSYHGTTLATLAVGGHVNRRKGMEPLLLDLPESSLTLLPEVPARAPCRGLRRARSPGVGRGHPARGAGHGRRFHR